MASLMGEGSMDGHLLTVIKEEGGYATPICSCGWTGRTCETPMAAGMEFAMNHLHDGGEGVRSDNDG